MLRKMLEKKITFSRNVVSDKLPHLKHIQWHKLKKKTANVNSVLGFIPIHNLEDLNNTIIADALTVTEIFINEKQKKSNCEIPLWKSYKINSNRFKLTLVV